MVVLASVEVAPIYAQVCLVDATWQDYPQWDSGDEPVAYRAESLTDPDVPPYPGFAVATRSDIIDGRSEVVRVEVVRGERPTNLRLILSSVLYVGAAGGMVGNFFSGLTAVDIREGDWSLEIWVDSPDKASVSHVVFALSPE